jgi:hypothetical protein
LCKSTYLHGRDKPGQDAESVRPKPDLHVRGRGRATSSLQYSA